MKKLLGTDLQKILINQVVLKVQKEVKDLLSKENSSHEAETWHTCIGHCPLQKLSFFIPGG